MLGCGLPTTAAPPRLEAGEPFQAVYDYVPHRTRGLLYRGKVPSIEEVLPCCCVRQASAAQCFRANDQ